MNPIISWLHANIVEASMTQTILAIALVSAIGLLFAKIKFGKVSLGVTFVFFVGITLAQMGVQVDHEIIAFIQSFGLVLFVYALGVEVGPSFFPSLRSKGLFYNLYALMMIVLTYLVVIALHYLTNIPMPNMLGIMSGAVTNTPVLAAVQSTLRSIYPDNLQLLSEAAMATAVTYPLGVVGVILALICLSPLKPKKENKQTHDLKNAYIVEFQVLNPAVIDCTVQELVQKIQKYIIISRIWRGEKEELIIPTSETRIGKGDHILVLCHEEDLEVLTLFFGKRDDRRDWNSSEIDWDKLDAYLNSKRVIITNPKINGVKLSSLKLRNRFGINITRVDRAGIELLAEPDLYLQLGDRLTIVGKTQALAETTELLGNSIKTLYKPRLISFFFGIFFGCLLGLIPLSLPFMSMPIRLGLAGGPIIVGILMGAFGPRLHISTYLTNSATQLIKQLGLVVYLAALGLSSGGDFLNTLLNGDGLLWLLIGFVVTLLPTLMTGWLCIRFFGHSYSETSGLLCGTMANPFALDYAEEQTQSQSVSVAYATVYPVAMFVRIITAQMVLLFFV